MTDKAFRDYTPEQQDRILGRLWLRIEKEWVHEGDLKQWYEALARMTLADMNVGVQNLELSTIEEPTLKDFLEACRGAGPDMTGGLDFDPHEKDSGIVLREKERIRRLLAGEEIETKQESIEKINRRTKNWTEQRNTSGHT